jgi:regulatory protein YycI of two-component signal transduction system YycFG
VQWSQIKTLFILSFLVLNVYLLVQYIDKQDRADLGVLSRPDASIEEQLESENITLQDIEVDITEDTYISVSQHMFTEDQKEEIANLDNQEPVIFDNSYIVSALEEPVSIPTTAPGYDINNMISSHIPFSESYSYGTWNEEMNVLIFFQETSGRPIYYNAYGLLMVFLNEDDEMVYYTQSMLGEPEQQDDMQSLIQPIQAIGTIFDRNQLHPNDEVSQVDIGYHTRIPLASGEQVFAPTYKITVNDDRSYFVNAIEGQTFPSEDEEFIVEMISSIITYVEQLDEDHVWKDDMLHHLNGLIENEINRSDTE